MTSKPETVAREIADEVIHHLRTMYPDALKAVPPSAVVSIRNLTAQLARAAIMAAKAEQREADALLVEGYPPDGFNAALYARTERHDEHDPFWKFEGDTGNWAALMGEVLKPYSAAIRKRGEG